MAEETRGEPVGVPGSSGAQRFLTRAMYVFFNKPVVFLLPALVITAFGARSAFGKADQYRSVGALSVTSTTFLSTLSQDRTNNNNSFNTAASTIALQFNELMQTDGFANSIVDGAGLAPVRDAGFLTLGEVRKNVYAVAVGDSLMRINAVATDPGRARSLANSAITTFKNWVISSEVSGSDVAQTFYDDQLKTYKTEVDAASQALKDYLTVHPQPVDVRDQRDIADQLEIQRLNDQLTRAQTRFDSAFDNRELSRLATLRSSADIGQRLKVLDEPTTPTLPESGLRAVATTIILFGALGTMVSIAAVALTCVLDRSILYAADLERLGAKVRAVVPRAKGMKIEGQRHLVPVAPRQLDAPMRTAG